MSIFAEESYGSSGKRRSYLQRKGIDLSIIIEPNIKLFSFSSLRNKLYEVFMPDGYPDSVSKDYLKYQIYDTIQAFASSITGTIATHAVLKGIGVGDENATAIAATFTWIMKDGAGMIGKILFAHLKGSALDADCKKWRLFADILNDFAIGVDIVSSYFSSWIVAFQCISGIARAIVGTAGSATRAALTQHQARRNNLADVSAKDGSQETLVNLIALICSIILLPYLSDNGRIVWLLFPLLTWLHIYANYKAVSVVQIEVFNISRYVIFIRHFIETNETEALNVEDVNKKENLFLFKKSQDDLSIPFGISISDHIKTPSQYYDLKNIYLDDGYLMSYNRNLSSPIKLSLCENRDSRTNLCALYHAIILHLCHFKQVTNNEKLRQIITSNGSENEILQETRKFVNFSFPLLYSAAANVGWDLTRDIFIKDEWRIKSKQN